MLLNSQLAILKPQQCCVDKYLIGDGLRCEENEKITLNCANKFVIDPNTDKDRTFIITKSDRLIYDSYSFETYRFSKYY